jgi:ubiquinone/menaquinone biosynthesis C-methylase UbiE
MKNSGATGEVERIRDVYSGYDVYAGTKWARDNPGNQAMVRERNEVIERLLRQAGRYPDAASRILDIGCGEGELLGLLVRWGAREANCYGVDLLPARVATATERFPGMQFRVANAETLEFPSASFDLITLFTVFSSILSPNMSSNLAREVARLLRADGCVLIYDFRVPSFNRHTRAIRRRDVRELFAGYDVRSQSLTLLPPLARRLGRLTRIAYPVLAACPWLRTHNMTLLRRTATA